jgi:hypothetical protein
MFGVRSEGFGSFYGLTSVISINFLGMTEE